MNIIDISENKYNIDIRNYEEGKLEFERRVNDYVVEAIRDIAADSETRKGYMNRPSFLDSGIFYTQDYFQALKQLHRLHSLEELINKHALTHGKVSTAHFNTVYDHKNPIKKSPYRFVLKSGVTPSAALQTLLEGFNLLECASVAQIAYYIAVQNLLGIEKFDILFGSESSYPFRIGQQPKHPLDVLKKHYIESSEKRAPLKRGDLVYFKNVIKYRLKHPFGHASGFNVICVDDTIGAERFVGLGLPPEGVTREEMQVLLLEEYNKPPVSEEFFSEELNERRGILMRESNALAGDVLSMEGFLSSRGLAEEKICCLNASFIAQLEAFASEEVLNEFEDYAITSSYL